jgi:hypothetical protein
VTHFIDNVSTNNAPALLRPIPNEVCVGVVPAVKNFQLQRRSRAAQVQGFAQGAWTDYRNDQIHWGIVTPPAPPPAVDLTAQQQQVVVCTVATPHLSTHWVNADAARTHAGVATANPGRRQRAGRANHRLEGLEHRAQDVVLVELGFARQLRCSGTPVPSRHCGRDRAARSLWY